MNKKAAAPLIAAILLILLVIGLIAFFSEDVPEFIEEVSENLCLPIKEKLDFCISNSSGIVLIGALDENYDFILNIDDKESTCSVGKDYLNIRTVCKDDFGYIYDKQNFEIEIYQDENLIKTITQVQLQNILLRALAKPERLGRILAKSGEGLFQLRGLIYILENWNNSNSVN